MSIKHFLKGVAISLPIGILIVLSLRYFQVRNGDLNHDGAVNVLDLGILSKNWSK